MFQILKNTFIHVPGIGKDTENYIWRNDIYNWAEFIEKSSKLQLSHYKKHLLEYHIKKSIRAYNNQRFRFFINNIPYNMHWRAYSELKGKCCFLDIETTGLDKHNDNIALIGLYNGKQSRFFVKGKNMNLFAEEIKKYPMLITFNGTCFDIPFIKEKFPKINFNKFHIDLRFAMKNIGYSGGLKKIEKMIGINRSDDLADIDGYEAVRLWHKYKRGNKESLNLLIKYNKADIENLKLMMEFAFQKLKEKEFFSVIK